MFNQIQFKQSHIESSHISFAKNHDVSKLARHCQINPQMLRNKLNPDQPHQLSVLELVKVTQATGDKAIVDGVLFELGLKAVELPKVQSIPKCPTSRMMEVAASTGEIVRHTMEITRTDRVKRNVRDDIVKKANGAISELVLLITEIEHKFQAIPVLIDTFHSMPSVPGFS